MPAVASDYHRTKAAAALAQRGVYPKQGVLHGLMYGMVFAAGLAIGTAIGNLPSWIAMVIGLIVLIAAWFWGASVDRRYDEAVAEVAVDLAGDPS